MSSARITKATSKNQKTAKPEAGMYADFAKFVFSPRTEKDHAKQDAIDAPIIKHFLEMGVDIMHKANWNDVTGEKFTVQGGEFGMVSVFMGAALRGKQAIMKALIDAGVNVNDIHHYDGIYEDMTPLMHMVIRGDLDTVKLLVEYGKADINLKTENGKPLIWLIQDYSTQQIAKYLVSKGLDAPADWKENFAEDSSEDEMENLAKPKIRS